MLQKVFLAECSETYRKLLKDLLAPYAREIVDLWEDPAAALQESPECLAVVDEAFLARGPGPARSSLSAFLLEGRITQLPLLFLERRERQAPFRISSRAFKLRRPFATEDFERILTQLGAQAQFREKEVVMTENENPTQGQEAPQAQDLLDASLASLNERIEAAIREAIAQANLAGRAQEILEKAVRETVPDLAEKIIKEEIERLTR